MQGFDPATSFGPDVAQRYDDDPRGDEAETVDFLAGCANGGPALELAIGTGRIAIPLAQHGIRVDGIELSSDMVTRMRQKPGGADLAVTIGDMSIADAPSSAHQRLREIAGGLHQQVASMIGLVRAAISCGRWCRTYPHPSVLPSGVR